MLDGFYRQNLQKRSKTEKMNIIIELFMFKLAEVPNFSLN